MNSVVIVRHGNTFAADETPRRIGRRTDIPLVASGIAQAQALGRWFRESGLRFDRVLVSPLRRTRETAELILHGTAEAPAPEPADWLSEIDHGPDEDRTDAAIVARIGAEALRRWDAEAVPPPDWLVDADMRLAGWRTLLARQRGGQTLVVTSNGAARFALMAQPDLAAAARALPSLKLRTGAWGMIGMDRGEAALLEWNRRPPAG